jgi:hypothetical protein
MSIVMTNDSEDLQPESMIDRDYQILVSPLADCFQARLHGFLAGVQ